MLNSKSKIKRKMFFAFAAFLCLNLIFDLNVCVSVSAYKLNVPKVLLPFYSSKLITFILEANSDETSSSTSTSNGNNNNNEDLCFVWSSSRSDIVSITPLYDNLTNAARKQPNECSNKALVAAVSKHPQRLTSIILAKEIKSDKLIRCDVIVDRIHSIRIKHTTTHLYLEDSPESFTAEALDSESNTFSSLEGLPFEWSIINDAATAAAYSDNLTATSSLIDSRNVLRISKFIESEYQVSESIRALEATGLSGHKILIEGLKTGTANVQAKVLDGFYKESLKTPLVRLLVVANILIVPSYPVYILVGGHVKYSVNLIKQSNIEKIALPSLQYYFESRDRKIADLVGLGGDESTIVGLGLGTVEVVLIDRNMKEKLFVKTNDQITNVESKVLLPPPTALVHVVEPDHLYFEIKNWKSSWILQVGRSYEIMILVNTAQNNQIHPCDNFNIESFFDKAKLKIDFKSKNGSYHIVTVVQKGLSQAQASLTGTFQPSSVAGEFFQPFGFEVKGQQDMELLDPIDVKPKLLIFAFFPSSSSTFSPAYEYLLEATGGSESFHWKSLNSTIATVSQNGMIKTRATILGKSQILVTDTRNIDIYAKSLVYILEPIDLKLLGCPVETQLGHKLYVNIEMNANLGQLDEFDLQEMSLAQRSSPNVPVSDCSRLKFEIKIKDEKIFKFSSVQSPSDMRALAKNYSFNKNACAVIVLDALQVGRTAIFVSSSVSFSKQSGESNQEQLVKLQSNELLIGSYSHLNSQKSQITLAHDSSLIINLYDGPLISSSDSYSQLTSISDEQVVQITPEIESSSPNQPNKFPYRVKCKALSQSLVNVKFSIWHKKTAQNACPLVFDHQIEVRCGQPESIQLNQLLVNNEDSDIEADQVALISKWKCPISLSSNLIVAHLDRSQLLVQLVVKDVDNNVFDNFTSLNVEWEIENRKLLEVMSSSSSQTSIKSIEVSAAKDRHGLLLLAADSEVSPRNRVFFQAFKINKRGVHANASLKLTAKMHLNEKQDKLNILSKSLLVKFVSLVQIEPESLTVFNHPSNVVTLALSQGSGHFQAEIETVQNDQLIDSEHRLKINQITDHNIVISPLNSNGLSLLHVFDYCIPPPFLTESFSQNDDDTKTKLILWPAAATARIQVAGINSILVFYEDENIQINSQIKVYVRISDANGHSIRVKYFPLMSLKGKLINSNNNNNNNNNNNHPLLSDQNELYASIEELRQEDYVTLDLSEQDKDYTAVYILHAIKEGIVSIQFEAHSDGYFENSKSSPTSTLSKIIVSPLKDIEIFSPLNVQPKLIELVRGANYQIIATGGANTPDASIQFEMASILDNIKPKKIIEIDANRIIEALDEGEIKVVAKSIGHACLPFSKTSSILSIASHRCNPEHRIARVYSQDSLVVRVVELRSIHIHTPLRSIKRGNEMPIHLTANDHKLSPLNFGPCKNLKYTWKINDHELATLYHPLAEKKNNNNNNEDSFFLFENSFSLRFLARIPGNVKVTVKVEFKNSNNKVSLYHQLSDSIDLVIFENAFLTHMPFLFANKNKLDLLQLERMQQQQQQQQQKQNVLLVSPGSQLQVKTNLDKIARRISYELTFFNELDGSNGKQYCHNNTIFVSRTGLITTTHLEHYQLKNFEQCTASLLVTLEVLPQQAAEQHSLKRQTLIYTIKLKPIAYSMIKLIKATTAPTTNSINNNKIQLSDSSRLQIKWQVKYYDNLGDVFDIVSLNNEYTLNRNDLVDFSNLNSNLFINTKKAANTKTTTTTPLVLWANSEENKFSTKVAKSGIFVMELSPRLFPKHSPHDYLSLIIDDHLNLSQMSGLTPIEANIGDILCLSNTLAPDNNNNDDGDDLNEDDEEEFSHLRRRASSKKWLSQNPSVASVFTSDDSLAFAVCLNKGRTAITTKSSHLEINVRPIESKAIKFLTRNSATTHVTNLIDETNVIQFKISSSSSSSSKDCTARFESYFLKLRETSSVSKLNEIVPFKCSASLYTPSGKRLDYMSHLINCAISFYQHEWTCNLVFVANSNHLLYSLIERDMDEPTLIRVYVDSVINVSEQNDDVSSQTAFVELPFVPAFQVQDKRIELPIVRASRRSYSESNLFSVDSFNLIVKATRQLHSHLVLSTNCPQLIQIKVSNAQKIQPSTSNDTPNSIVTISYDIMSSQSDFDFNAFSSLMEQQNGNLYVQIKCSLTQQTERIPIKFMSPGNIGMQFLYSSDNNNNNNPNLRIIYEQKKSSFVYSLFGWLLDVPSSQTTFFIMLSLFLISIVYLLKSNIKSSRQQAAEQISLNASVAAAATAAASAVVSSSNSHRNSGSYSSFNPYRYFAADPITQTTAAAAYDNQSYRNSANLNSTNPDRSANHPLINRSFKSEPLDRRSNLFSSSSPKGNQTVLNRSRLNNNDRDGIRLFSVNNNDNQHYADLNQSYESSDNDESRNFDRRVPPRNPYL